MNPRFRRISVVVTGAALVLSSLAGPAAAHALKGAGKAERLEHARSHVQQAKARQQEKKAAVAAKKAAQRERAAAKRAAAAARRAAAKARYTVTGTLEAVGADTVEVLVEGGNRKALHGQVVTYTVAETAKVTRDDAPATLADLVAGDAVTLHGSDQTGLVTKVAATSPVVEEVDENLDENLGENLDEGGSVEE